jgi:hypothetical protein
MAEISNKTMALLILGAIIISLGGTYISLAKLNNFGIITGKAPVTTGTISLNIQEQVLINVTTTAMAFGNVYVNETSCSLNSQEGGDGTCPAATDGTSANGGLVVENIGNSGVNISMNPGKNGSEFLGGTDSIYQVKCRAKQGAGTAVISSYLTINETVNDTETLCYAHLPFTTGGTTYDIYFDANLTIPSDSSGAKTDTITFIGLKNAT